ncbi:hypothetical protein ACFQ07_09035, partial [Actinomadura adrarensis]
HRPGPRAPDGPLDEPPDGPLDELLEVHVLPWVPAYLRELRDAARLAPYRTIADLTARFLTADPRP